MLGGLDLAQDATCERGDGGAERGQAHPGREALEEPALELVLEARDDAGKRGLGHGHPACCHGDPPRLGDGKKPDQIASFLELVSRKST